MSCRGSGLIVRSVVGAVATAAVLVIPAESRAADMPRKAPVGAPLAAVAESSWAGSYLGLFAGYGGGIARSTAPFNPGPGFFYNFGGNPYSFPANGFFGGATLGYNWQSGALVAGIEGEIGYLGLRGSSLDPNGVAAGFPDTTTSFRSDFFGALSARLGIATGAALLYAKGGGAVLNAKGTTVDPCVAPPAGCGTETLFMSGRKTMLGWSGGGGVEWRFAPNWSIKAEYVYFDFGNLRTFGISSVGDPYFQTISVTAHTGKINLNYRFLPGPVVARY